MKKATIALAGTALALGAFILFFERFWPTSAEAALLSRIIAPISAETIEKVRVEGPQGEFVFEKQEDSSWLLTKPLQDRMDPELTGRLLHELSNIVILETIDRHEIGSKDGPQLDALGFGEAESITAVLEFSDAREPLELVFGSEAVFEGTAYLRAPGLSNRPDVYVVQSIARKFLEDPVGTLRDRSLIRYHPGAIESYVMRTASGEVELAREPDAPVWSILKPLQARANDEISFFIIDEITRLRAETILNEAPPAAPEEALDENTAVFILRPQNGEPIELVFRQGELLSDEPDKLTVSVSGRDAQFVLTNDFVRRLPATVNQLRHPYLGDFNPKEVVKIEITSPGKLGTELVFDAENNRWVVNFGGNAQTANQEQVMDLIEGLNEALIIEFASDTASRLDEFGLTKPLVTISVTSEIFDPAELEAYRAEFKKVSEEGGDPNAIPQPEATYETKNLRFGASPTNILLNANYEGSPFIYSIDPTFLTKHAPLHPISWRSKRLPSFSHLDIRGIDRQLVGQPRVYLRYDDRNNRWTARIEQNDASARIDTRQAERLARHLGSLEVLEWLTDLAAGLEALDTRPSGLLRVSVVLRDGDEEYETDFTIKFAPAIQNEEGVISYYGQFVGHPDIFLLSADSYDRIMAPVIVNP